MIDDLSQLLAESDLVDVTWMIVTVRRPFGQAMGELRTRNSKLHVF